MNDSLLPIYRAVSAGRLTPAEALTRVKALKQQMRSAMQGLLLATRQWTDAPAKASNAVGSAQEPQQVLLWGLPRDVVARLQEQPSTWQLVELASSDATAADAAFNDVAAKCFDAIKSLLAHKAHAGKKVHVRLIVAATPELPVAQGLDALLKTAMEENPALSARLVQVPADIEPAELLQLVHREAASSELGLLRYHRDGRVLKAQVSRWQTLAAAAQGDAAFSAPAIFKEGGCYLVTGGAGAIGLQFAREIVAQTARARIVLAGRSAEAEKTLQAIATAGHRVEYVALDVTHAEEVDALIARLQAEGAPLNGIIHCAGIIRDNFIIRKPPAEFAAVLAPKVAGLVNLDRATRLLPLDFVLLCSSIAGCWGNSGQADYAAANGFMDEFAHYRNRLVKKGKRHGRTLSVNWPFWQEGGMPLDTETRDRLQKRTGMQPLQTASAIRAVYEGFALACDQLLVMEGELPTMQALLQGSDAMAPTPALSDATAARTTALVDDAFKARALEYLCQQFSLVLKIPVARLRPQAPLEQYGIDSILAMKLVNHLESLFGKLPKTLAFEYQTVAELNGYFCSAHTARLVGLLAPAGAGSTDAKPAANQRTPAKALASKRISNASDSQRAASDERGFQGQLNEPIAIVGLSGRYPEARDVQAFWRNLRDGKDCIVEVPKERWDWRDYYSENPAEKGRHYSKWGGFIEGVDEFDARFFNIAPVEAEMIDPQERLFLQHAWMAMEDAGYTRASLQISSGHDLPAQVGVYAGVMYGEYQLFGAEASLQGDRTGFASSLATIANRVSYFLNLHGPSMVVDTMCSSSLTAIHLACQDLKLGRTSLAFAGGVNVTIHPNKYLMLSAGRFISTDGNCQSFGEGGDGYIPGEGVGVVVLKRLSDAQRDGNHIYGVIRGSALNHGGKTNGYTVPNPQAQAAAIRRAFKDAQVDSRHISYIEAHGTGTKLGDPIEIAALGKVFAQSTRETGFCLVGSVKSNIGHSESAAGVAALTKVLLQLKYKQIVPSLHSQRLNPHIDFDSTAFVVNQTLRPWEPLQVSGKKVPRIAGISSFGAGGSNAHLIVEEYSQEAAAHRQADADLIVPLSARTADGLQQKARELLGFVRGITEPLDLRSVAYTLQVGREGMDERLGFLARSIDELAGKLEAYLDGNTSLDGVYRGQVKANTETMSLLRAEKDFHATIEKWIAEGRHSKLAELWVKGLDLDWHQFHTTKPQLCSLPTYPFARQRYWVNKASAPRRAPTAVLHPLLHNNTSDFTQQSFTATFTGEEAFLAGTPGARRLSEAACLEMARAAIDASIPAQQRASTLELRDIAWAQPGASVENKRVTIALFDKNGEQMKFEIYSAEGSGKDEQALVLCQGRALYSQLPGPASLDLTAIAAQSSGKLAELGSPAVLAQGQDDYVLHPEVMQAALEAAADLTGGVSRPYTMASLRVVRACSQAKLAWLRPSAAGKSTINLDLCDEQGRVCVQMRDIGYQPAGGSDAAASADASIHASIPKTVPVPFDAAPSSASPGLILGKPGAIALLAPSTSSAIEREASLKPKVSLLSATSEVRASGAPRVSAVSLFDHGSGIFSILVDAALSAPVIEDVLRAMHTAEHASQAKVLMIEGASEQFLTGGSEAHRAAIELKLYRAIVEFPYPVIAVARGNATGTGILAAAVCDFLVCSESARYSFTVQEEGLYPSAVDAVFIERLGQVLATDFLYLSAGNTGAELKAKGWTCPVVPRDQVVAYAQNLAADLAQKPQESLRLLKQHLARRIAAAVQALAITDDASLEWADDDRPQVVNTPSERIQLDAHGARTLIVTIRAQAKGSGAAELLTDLQSVMNQIGNASPYRCVVLTSEFEEFLPSAGVDVAQGFKRALLAFNRPVIAALNGSATGMAWYAAQFCDACVYSEKGRYSCAEVLRHPMLTSEAVCAFSLRFAEAFAKEILMTGGECSGAELRATYGASHVVSAEEVLPGALRLADALVALPAPVLARWKQRTASIASDAMASLAETSDDDAHAVIGPIALQSQVVSAIAHPEGILEVRVADRAAKNMFSDALMSGLNEVFAHAERSPAYKVVVLTGYDNYFLSGGTQDGLLAIQKGTTKFTDNKVFQLPLLCKLPVIAAMQGHGIGAGWAMGMYADFTLFSKGGRYLSPYMGYGFTPGAGSTLMFPEKIGYDLARETLFTAQRYSGGELKKRGLRNPALPGERVLEAAMTLAKRIAQSPRSRLIALKQRFSHSLQASLQDTFERELAMHERTFVGQTDTLARIQRHFDRADPVEQAAPVAQSTPSLQEDFGAITSTLKMMLADELRMQLNEIGDDEQFVDLGLDSITGVTWIRKINEKYGTSIEAVKVYSHPTLAQLSRYVKEEAEKARPAVVAPPVERSVVKVNVPTQRSGMTSLTSWRDRSRAKVVAGTSSAARPQPIAVIGTAGQFAMARNLEAFWQNIAAGKDCIREIPTHRWNNDLYYQAGEPAPGKTYGRWMGALEEYDLFDAGFFNISPREAKAMDPQQRLFLQACWHGIEHAGYNPRSLAGSKCGLFVGCAASDYHQLSKKEQLSGQGFTGAAPSILAGRISYLLDLRGPSLSIDTACSSSLVAIAAACDSLVTGGSDLALAGGVSFMAGPSMQIMTSQMGMLSPNGRCFSFDDRANGIVNGEGVGVVMLKRLADAERDGDCILGVIEGWGVNQDGKTNGITAPNPDSQTRLQQEVYDKFHIDPAGIQLIEAHGTGTALGDPIEVAGLKASFKKYTQAKGYCALGSVKSNVGHCLTAAGVSGFLKALLALQHQQLPPTIHFGKLNKHICLEDSPFYVNDQLRVWQRNGIEPRRAAINSFGFGGTNAHVVVAEYRGQQDVAGRSSELALIPLSARTVEQLQHRVGDLLAFLRGQSAATQDLHRIAYTLQAGREAMNERVAFIVSSVADLNKKLQAFVEGANAQSSSHVYRGQVSRNSDSLLALGSDPDFQLMIAKWIGRRELPRVAELWVKGLALDWTALHAAGCAPRRIGLPGYPFAKERYWIDVEESAPQAITRTTKLRRAARVFGKPQAVVAPTKRSAPLAITQEHIQQQLKTSLAAVLDMKPAEVNVRTSFTELGLDSILGVEWMKSINEQHATTSSATRLYDYPNIKELAAFLIREMPAQPQSNVQEAEVDVLNDVQGEVQSEAEWVEVPVHDAGADKIAIIGMSCRFPQSENVEAFWENLKAGKDCVIEVPADRWGAQSSWYHPDPRHGHTSYSKWGGFLDRIDTFDALFFGISPAEAELIDPQQRIFLEECWKTIESAGYAPSALSEHACGVYVGCSTGDYARVLNDSGHDTIGPAFMGTSSAILAARIAYYLNLKGPALAIDTACSSSLVALHLACESIRNGENELALAGGVNLLATSYGHILTSQVGMPSNDGKCAPFDASANGIVYSEGCGVLLLKALSAAQRDADPILGVIQGSGINQDGRTNGITAPSSNSQKQLLRQVYAKFGVDTKRVSYVEAHGTATPLGDPIEVNALTAVLGEAIPERNVCALGSVKSNIGHTGFAAGVAGVVKVLLCMKHRMLVPALHYREPNPHIEFEKSPFFVNTQCREWSSEEPRLATVSSFGFSGTNAHAVIEEYVSVTEHAQAGAPAGGKVLVPLSAKALEQLRQKACDLLEFIRAQEQPVDLARLAYTLQVGRDAMDHRLAIIVSSVDELAGKLQAWFDGKAHIEGVYSGRASSGDDMLAVFAADAEMRGVIERWIAQKNLPKVADLWLRGFELDWSMLHKGATPRRMVLPTYPFAKERCWVERKSTSVARVSTATAVAEGMTASATLHPLLHRNTSNLLQQSYTSRFSGDEFFLCEHRVHGQLVLPAVAYLEMVRTALLDAMPSGKAPLNVELRHVVWSQPIIVAEPKNVTVALFSENDTQIGFEVYSHTGGSGDEFLHCQGNCIVRELPAERMLDLAGLFAQMRRPPLDGSVLYQVFNTMGLEHGPAFQGILSVHRGENQVLVELRLPDSVRRGGAYDRDYVLHPSLMDSALQGSIALIDDIYSMTGKSSLPFALESLRILAPCTERMVAWVRPSEGGLSTLANFTKVDVDMCDQDGRICVQMRGFSSRPLAKLPAPAALHLPHELESA